MSNKTLFQEVLSLNIFFPIRCSLSHELRTRVEHDICTNSIWGSNPHYRSRWCLSKIFWDMVDKFSAAPNVLCYEQCPSWTKEALVVNKANIVYSHWADIYNKKKPSPMDHESGASVGHSEIWVKLWYEDGHIECYLIITCSFEVLQFSTFKFWMTIGNWTIRNEHQCNSNQNTKIFSRKCNWKFHLQNGGHIVQGVVT